MRILLLVSFLMLSTTSLSKSFVVETPKRYVEVVGVVSGSMIDSVAAKIFSLSTESSEPIYLLINSPGGYVSPGTTILDAMNLAQERGVKFKCISGVLAASMAFILYAKCDERYALSSARLMFHPVSIGVQGARVRELYWEIEQHVKEEEHLIEHMIAALGMHHRTFMNHFLAETFWTALGLERESEGFLTIVSEVKGVPNLFKWQGKRGLFGQIPSHTLKVIKRFESTGVTHE